MGGTFLVSAVSALASAAGVVAGILFLVIWLVFYVLSCVGLYGMAVNRRMDYPWLAWIPIVRYYLLGELVSEKAYFIKWRLPYPQVILPLLFCLAVVTAGIPIVGNVLLVLFVFYYDCVMYRLYRLYAGSHAPFDLLLSMVFPLLFMLFVFLWRNRKWNEYL